MVFQYTSLACAVCLLIVDHVLLWIVSYCLLVSLFVRQPEMFEDSALIRPTIHTNQSWNQRSSNRRDLKTPALRFRLSGKHFENGALRKRLRRKNHVIYLTEFSSDTNPKYRGSGDCCIFKFLRLGMDENIWCVFKVQPQFSNSDPISFPEPRSPWQQSENESSGSNHFERTKEITEFCPSGLTQSASAAHAWNGCSQSYRFLLQARRIVGSGDENACDPAWCRQDHNLVHSYVAKLVTHKCFYKKSLTRSLWQLPFKVIP